MIGRKIKERREALGMTQEELAKALGYKSKSTINKIELEINDVTQSKVVLFANALNTSPAYLMGWEDSTVSSELNRPTRTVKIYGRIAGGAPIEMIENVIDEVDLATLPEKYDGRYFGLQISGDSMEPDIKNGDYIICVETDDAESGDIVAVTVNGEDATCKRILKYADGIRLVPINPACDVVYYTNEEVENLPVRVIGKVMESRHKF